MEPFVLLCSATMVTLILLGIICSPSVTFERGNLIKEMATISSPSSAVLMPPPICCEGFGRRFLKDRVAVTLPDEPLLDVKVDQADMNPRLRTLLFSLYDISPPGLWPVGDDDQLDGDELQRRRLLHDRRGLRAALQLSKIDDSRL